MSEQSPGEPDHRRCATLLVDRLVKIRLHVLDRDDHVALRQELLHLGVRELPIGGRAEHVRRRGAADRAGDGALRRVVGAQVAGERPQAAHHRTAGGNRNPTGELSQVSRTWELCTCCVP